MVLVFTKVQLKTIYISFCIARNCLPCKTTKISPPKNSRSIVGVIYRYGATKFAVDIRQFPDNYAVLRQQYAAIQALTLL